MACLHAHMFTICRITCNHVLVLNSTSLLAVTYHSKNQVGVAILVSLLQGMWIFSLEPCTGKPTLERPMSKLGLRSTSSNAMNPKVRL